MTKTVFIKRSTLSTAMASLIVASIGASFPAPAVAQQSGFVSPSNDVALSVGAGRMVRLDGTMTDLFVANDAIADVQVRSANQIFIFGKAAGETTIYATNKAGKTIYSANVRVGNNIGSIDQMLDLAMPDAQITATPINGMVLLTGTVASPVDIEEANRLVQAFVGEGSKVISRLKTATPMQVLLKVKVAEVNRSLTKNVGVNLLTRDQGSGFIFGIGRGNPGTITDRTNPLAIDPATGAPQVIGTLNTFNKVASATTIGLAGRLLGLDLLSTIELNENTSLVTTLAEPILAALSGETATFLAGGEFPIATSTGLNGTSVEFKEYGISLAFTPTVMEGGRISMRVRPEVSELTSAGAIKINGIEIPGISTRRTETSVELGSGQSFMIGGLLRNNANNSVEKAPFLGDIPILGALFRSKSFRRDETELVIIVTPYLVKPVNASQIALPTDGFRLPDEPSRILLDQRDKGITGEQRPEPRVTGARTLPGVGAVGSASLPAPTQTPAPAPVQQAQRPTVRPKTASATPGFSF
jgi:pilus assembly protein CpaC